MDFHWEVAPGQALVLFGPSGAGKSTILRAIAGLIRPRKGRMEIAGQVVYDGEEGIWMPAHRRRVGYLTQGHHLFPHLRVDGNIAYGLKGLPREERENRVRYWCEALQLEGLEERRPWEMSGGQQQRVALARALAPGPSLLLLDEPFSSLDQELRRALQRELREMLGRQGVPVVVVTHDREEALALGDRVQVIDQGRTIAEGLPVEVLGQPGQNRVARLVGVENLLDLDVESRNLADGTMSCRLGDFRLEVPMDQNSFHHYPPSQHDPARIDEGDTGQRGPRRDDGDKVQVGIRSSDIILAETEPTGISARNRIPGTVTAVEPRPPGYTVTLDCGVSLSCHITRASLAEMDIEPGRRLWAVVKASSCFLVGE